MITRISILLVLFLLCIKMDAQDDGYKKYYYSNGKLSSEGSFKNGNPDGYWKSYYITGIVKSEGNRKNGNLDSVWVFYNEIGDTLSKISYVNGMKNGYYIKYSNDNARRINFVISKELYYEDLLQGRSYYYFENNGNVKSICYYLKGKKEGKEYIYNVNGQIISVNNYIKGRVTEIENINRFDTSNRKDGLWREYYSNFRIKREINYKSGILDGIYKEFDEFGNLEVSLFYENGNINSGKNESEDQVEVVNEYYENGELEFSGSFMDDKPIGVHRYFTEEGIVSKSEEYNSKGILIGEGIVDKEGFRQGEWINYYDSGEIRSKGFYIDNNKNGEWIYYFKDGQVEQRGKFNDNKNEGLWLWYDENGKLLREENFYNGRNEGEYVEYNEEGKIIAKGEYIDGEKDGAWFYDVGDIYEEGNYIIGLKDGKWKATYKNENPRFEGNFIQGNPDGMHVYFYDTGTIEEEQFYNAGFKEKVWKRYDKYGNLKMSITYKDDKEIRINGFRIEEISDTKNKLIQ